MKTDLWCLNDEAVLLLVEPVKNLQDCLWVGLHHVDEEVGGLKVAPVGVKDVEGLGLQGLVVVGVAIDVHLQAVLRVNLLYKAGQTLEMNSTLALVPVWVRTSYLKKNSTRLQIDQHINLIKGIR